MSGTERAYGGTRERERAAGCYNGVGCYATSGTKPAYGGRGTGRTTTHVCSYAIFYAVLGTDGRGMVLPEAGHVGFHSHVTPHASAANNGGAELICGRC
eukprot:3709824-Rhodomonas_salina.1